MTPNSEFQDHVEQGLTASPKQLSSKYFYDAIGDALFVDIMGMPEYYPTRCEHEIFAQKPDQLAQALGFNDAEFVELVELGAGDGTKTQELLAHLLEHDKTFSYIPIDISQHALDGLGKRLAIEMPDLNIKPRRGEYFEVLSTLESPHKKAVLFLGSNLGNLMDDRASSFLRGLSEVLRPGDHVLLGLDLIKAHAIVSPAYNDAGGITSRFNLNLLTRMNRELGANFDLNKWSHFPSYDEKTGVASSSIKSDVKQKVTFNSMNKSFAFDAGECIHTEISRKYSVEVLEKLIAGSGFKLVNTITDSKEWFADFVLQRV